MKNLKSIYGILFMMLMFVPITNTYADGVDNPVTEVEVTQTDTVTGVTQAIEVTPQKGKPIELNVAIGDSTNSEQITIVLPNDGSPFKDVLMQNLWMIILGVILALEQYLGATKKLEPNSTLQLIFDIVKKIFRGKGVGKK